jgi:hypothetical protein
MRRCHDAPRQERFPTKQKPPTEAFSQKEQSHGRDFSIEHMVLVETMEWGMARCLSAVMSIARLSAHCWGCHVLPLSSIEK